MRTVETLDKTNSTVFHFLTHTHSTGTFSPFGSLVSEEGLQEPWGWRVYLPVWET